jgi:outer membrane protein OmpA-like peptidoglycan-associated protein
LKPLNKLKKKPVAMNIIRLFALVGIFTSTSVAQPALAKESSKQSVIGEHPNYVVIGAFAIHKNAIRFTRHASKLHLSAKFEMNAERHLYYVYVLSTDDRDQAINEAQKLRTETEFTDTWVYSGSLGNLTAGKPVAGVDINPDTKVKMEVVPATEKLPASTEVVTTPAPATESAPEAAVSKPESSNKSETEGKSFIFEIFRGTDSKPIEGEVNVIDNDKLKKVGTYKGNAPVRVADPHNKSGNITLVSEVFGYRKMQRDINYATPVGDGITEEEGSTKVPFEMVRLRKGDIAVMYNVFFFKDAGVMRPESRYEVNSLLQMMQENPNYEIRIHGHTNGSAAGKIISMGEGGNFFSLTGTKDGFGSAKGLSEERGNTIKAYLVSNGIDEKRLHVKAWGGKRPIHDKHSNRANENVRVEIEIIKE